MINVGITDYTMLIAFWLGFTRWTSIMFQLPIFDNTAVPSIVKILSSLVLTYAFFPVTQGFLIADIRAYGADNFWYLTIYHSVVGLLIGFLVKSILSIFVAAGAVMTQQIGFASVTYFDPTQSVQIGPFEKMIQWTIIVMVISTGALLPMFKGVVESFGTINMQSLGQMGNIHIFFDKFFRGIFQSAFLLATPILFTNLLLNLVMGIVARTIPQMNIIMVSFVVNIGIGLTVFFAISEELFQVAYKMYVEKLGDWFQFVV